MTNKAHEHPFGSSVIPHNGLGEHVPKPPRPGVPGAPSPIPGSIGVAGAPAIRGVGEAKEQPSDVATAFDNLIDAIAGRVADKVIARLDARGPALVKPIVRELFDDLNDFDVETLNKTGAFQTPPADETVGQLAATLEAHNQNLMSTATNAAAQMHIDLEQALREREHVKVMRFAPGPLAFNVTIEGNELWSGPEGDGPVNYRTCTAYAQPYGQGYTDGAKPDEYVLICKGRQIYRCEDLMMAGIRRTEDPVRGYSAGLTLAEVLAIVDGPLRSPSWGSETAADSDA